MAYKTLTPGQSQAVIYKVEDEMKDADIAKRINVTRAAVHQFWKKPHIQRELARQQDRFSRTVTPQLQSTYMEIRRRSLAQIEDYLDDEGNPKARLKPMELITLVKTMNESLAASAPKEASEEGKVIAKDLIEKYMTPEEIQILARRAIHGEAKRTKPIRELSASASTGDNQTGGAG